VIGALGYAIDLSEGQPEGHSARAGLLGMRLGRAAGLPDEALWELYYTLQLKDLGRAERAAIARAATSGEAPRRDRAASVGKQLELGEWVVASVQCVDACWDGSGQPGLEGEHIPVTARIASIAEIAELFHAARGPANALAEVRSRAGTWFDPELVEALCRLGPDAALWSALGSPDVGSALVAEGPARRSVAGDDGFLDRIAAAFGELLDINSPHTAAHSSRVAFYTDLVAEEMNVGAERRRWLRRAALLHDLGKVGVPRSILDKPGRLTAEEIEEVHRHSVYTEQILARVPPFAEIARLASAHHERLDGEGYPRRLHADQIPLEARIITAADIFDGISSERPYHGAISFEATLDIMSSTLGTAVDRECFAALVRVVEALGHAATPTMRVAA
jgi:HD-GYP domain-containing protein (c-di-GMP phosphodiesterase class II)